MSIRFDRLTAGPARAPHEWLAELNPQLHAREDRPFVFLNMVASADGRATYEGRAPLPSWLHRIATNVCLDAIRKRSNRAVPLDPASTTNGHYDAAIQPSPRHDQGGVPAGAHDLAAGIETEYEHREAAALALGLALHLPDKQRAVLILREVLGFSARETASSLATTVPAVNSALQRARANLDDGLDPDRPERSPSASDDGRFQEAVERFMDALKRGDIDAVVGIAADPTLSKKRPRTLTALPA